VFSQRSTWDLQTNLRSRALQQARAEGRQLLDLTQSNPTRAGLGYPAELASALNASSPLTYDPLPLGMPAARAAVACSYAARGVSVAPGNVVLASSTSEAYGYLFKLLTDPGDNVLVPRPSYPLFDYLTGLENVEPRRYPLRYSDGRWVVDMDWLAAAVDERTRAILLVSPNNPTGSYIGAGERREIENLAGECGLAIIADEVFADYELEAGAPGRTCFAAAGPVLTFSLGGLSKALAAPQLKLSWLTVQGPGGSCREALARLEVIADTYLSVSTQVQLALPRLLELAPRVQQQVLGRLRQNLQLLRRGLPQGAATMLICEGGWYAVVRFTGDEEQLTLDLLIEDGVLVHPGYFYDFRGAGYLVLSLLAAEFGPGLERLARRLSA
jgi:alanine-synthesizing transaminase